MSYDELDEEFENTFGYSGRDEGYDDYEMEDLLLGDDEFHKKPNCNAKNNGTPQNGCYIATCVYGSYDCPEVWTLRRFRDLYLQNNIFGRAFVKLYYETSPTVVALFGKSKTFKNILKPVLDSFVIKLQERGYSSKQYKD